GGRRRAGGWANVGSRDSDAVPERAGQATGKGVARERDAQSRLLIRDRLEVITVCRGKRVVGHVCSDVSGAVGAYMQVVTAAGGEGVANSAAANGDVQRRKGLIEDTEVILGAALNDVVRE